MTSTQARFIAENSTANAMSIEPKGSNTWWFNNLPYNRDAKEYIGLDMDLSDDEEMEIEQEETLIMTNAETGATWRVTPDYGELDANIVSRE